MTMAILRNIIFCIPILIISSCSKKVEIKDYSKQLQISFPEDMDLIFYENQSDFQDYSVTSIYKLTFNQKNSFLDQVSKKLANPNIKEEKNNLRWYKCDDYYSCEYENKDEGILISVVFVAKNNLSTLNILEVKH